jgi:MFS family permease
LFIFSFSAGFGAIYFKEIVAKIFTHKFRGKTMSVRQFFSGAGAILSGAVTGYILQTYEAPFSFGILFVASSFIMGLGYLSIGTVAEPIKTKIKQKEKSFKEFLSNAFAILKSDRQLQVQIFTFLLAYSYLFALPFVIVEAKQKISLNGVAIGWLITSQMVGAMLSNLVWGKLSSHGKNKLIAQITIFTTIVALSMLFFINSLYGYLVLFFLVGSAVDGNRIASSNLLLIIAPEDKRPIYSALQVNIVSFGMFFSILGGIILTFTSYMALYCFAILLLCVAFWSSFKLID